MSYKSSDFEEIPVYKNLFIKNELKQKKEDPIQEKRKSYLTIALIILIISFFVYFKILY
jgi:hypothetical protein